MFQQVVAEFEGEAIDFAVLCLTRVDALSLELSHYQLRRDRLLDENAMPL